MDGAGGELLARAGLTRDEHRPGRGGGALDQVLDLRHRAARADERVERQVGRNLTLQQVDLARELTAVGGRAHAHQQLVAKERLLHEVDGAELHRLDRGLDRAKAGHHDERRVDAHVAELAQDVDAREPRHPHVRQDDVEGAAPGELESFFAGRDLLHGVAGGPQHPAGALAHAGIVVDEEDAGHERR